MSTSAANASAISAEPVSVITACTAPVASDAATIDAIIAETAATTITERGATRLDDQTNDASMELRKKEGYF